MRYNPYMRRRRLNSSTEQRTISDTEITRRAADYLYKNFKLGAADFASFNCKIYSTNQPVDLYGDKTETNYYLQCQYEIGKYVGSDSRSVRLVSLDESAINKAVATLMSKMGNRMLDQIATCIEVGIRMSLDDAGVEYRDIQVSDAYRYEDWTYACTVSLVAKADGNHSYAYSEQLTFELTAQDLEQACNWFADIIIDSVARG